MSETNPQVEEIFHATRMKPSEERGRYLDDVCGEDVVLRGRVEALLSADARSGDLLAAPALGRTRSPAKDPGTASGRTSFCS